MTLLVGLFPWTAKADVTKTVGATGADYATLGLAFSDINANTGGIFTGVISLQIIDNITETATAQLNASANWSAMNIYPTVTGKTIGGDFSGVLIKLYGATNVTIDGRLNATGSTRDLTITNTGGLDLTQATTIRIDNGSSNNTIKYCTIKGSSTTENRATMMFVANNNSNNTVSNNLFTNANDAKRPQVSILSAGSVANNNLNTISNNEFANCLSGTFTSSRAIYLTTFTTNWTVSGNSFYETTSIVPNGSNSTPITVIGVTSSSNTVTGNYIGGSAAQCGSATLTKTAYDNNVFIGIYLAVGGTPISTVSNNIIQNINWSNYSLVDFTPLSLGGGINCTGNTIGAATGTGSITVTDGAAGGYVIGIRLNSGSGAFLVDNNTIGSITTNNFVNYFFAIWIQSTGSHTISNNTIGSTSTAGSISAGGAFLYGIRGQNTGSTIISGNTFENINSTIASGGNLHLMYLQSGTYTVKNNFITKLFFPNSTASSNVMEAIYIVSTVASSTSSFYNNIISLGGNFQTKIYGIWEANSVATATTNIYFNTIYIGGTELSTTANSSWCIYSANAGTYIKSIKNNILVSTRSMAGTPWDAHWALYASAGLGTGTFTCSNNDYFVSGGGSNLGYYGAKVNALPIVPGEVNSLVLDPLFANAGGALATDYKPNATVSLPGTAIAGITTDFSNTSRGGTPGMGALESGIYTKLNTIETTTNPRIISNATGIAVPLTGESNIELYTINGLLIEKTRANGMYTRSLSNGMYVISIDGKVSKFIK